VRAAEAATALFYFVSVVLQQISKLAQGGGAPFTTAKNNCKKVKKILARLCACAIIHYDKKLQLKKTVRLARIVDLF
jgi:hypothetical protein